MILLYPTRQSESDCSKAVTERTEIQNWAFSKIGNEQKRLPTFQMTEGHQPYQLSALPSKSFTPSEKESLASGITKPDTLLRLATNSSFGGEEAKFNNEN